MISDIRKSFFDEQRSPLPVPWLEETGEPLVLRPGRQLFVDDWLIESTDCIRIFHSLIPFDGNPVLKPETELEIGDGSQPLAAPFNDGVWYDPSDHLYKLYYHAGWFRGTACAVSTDGIRWERPDFGVEGHTNAILPIRPDFRRDGGLVWLDQETDSPDERWKMFLFFRHNGTESGELYTSPDGIRWNFRSPAGPCGDNTSFFYDPFLKRWVFSIRSFYEPFGRTRDYFARPGFAGLPWSPEDRIPWARADRFDPPEEGTGIPHSQLYDLNAAPYESLMLGLFAIFNGPENDVCARLGVPKRNDLHYAFSRDGFHWLRPENRQPALRCTRKEGDWDRGYLHAAGGLCLVFRDRLRFYYGAWDAVSRPKTGSAPVEAAMYAGGATGFAELRRDGFASMRSTGHGFLTTRRFLRPGKYLFVNAAAGGLRAEVFDSSGQKLPGFSAEECLPFSGDSCCMRLCWKNRETLPEGELKLRFTLTDGDLYSFWCTDDDSGKSGGYLAAGSADYPSGRDA